MVSWHITWGAPGCLLSTGCAMAMNIMRRVSFSTTKNSVSFVSVDLSPWLPWASHLCTWSSSSAPGEQGLNSNQKGSSPPLCLYQCADEIHLFLNQPILSTLLQFFLWDSLLQFQLLLLNNLPGERNTGTGLGRNVWEETFERGTRDENLRQALTRPVWTRTDMCGGFSSLCATRATL